MTYLTTPTASPVGGPARVAEPGEGISLEELQLAARNHGMPLEAMHQDVTPPGLHYVLVHYDIPMLDPSDFRLEVSGCVERKLGLGADLYDLPSRTVRVTMECAGNGRAQLLPRPVSQPWLVEAVGTADWTGVPLRYILDQAVLTDDAHSVVFTGADHGVERGVEQDYQRGLTLADALDPDVLVVHSMNGQPLPPQHGFPLRLIVPGWYGMAQVKWLRAITVIDHEFDGYQNAVAYRLKQQPDDAGTPITRIEPRALLVPPGYPDFMSRHRFLHPGPVTLHGRAWSGWAPVDRVEVTTDGGATWSAATLGPEPGRYAWRGFTFGWEAGPGTTTLAARAYDGSGRAQPEQAGWNRGGFTNNSAQTVEVTVLDA
ncbi:MAG: molybdopterin-dependent oxidoreductase [Propionibacteriales bacterium]|nr:molybdopterin-dependent oxidoreductase [Propionibacteriales bacterium]